MMAKTPQLPMPLIGTPRAAGVLTLTPPTSPAGVPAGTPAAFVQTAAPRADAPCTARGSKLGRAVRDELHYLLAHRQYDAAEVLVRLRSTLRDDDVRRVCARAEVAIERGRAGSHLAPASALARPANVLLDGRYLVGDYVFRVVSRPGGYARFKDNGTAPTPCRVLQRYVRSTIQGDFFPSMLDGEDGSTEPSHTAALAAALAAAPSSPADRYVNTPDEFDGKRPDAGWRGVGFVNGPTSLRAPITLWKHGERSRIPDATIAALLAEPDRYMRAYGVQSGQCAVCGRALTDRGSTALGVGPVCAARAY